MLATPSKIIRCKHSTFVQRENAEEKRKEEAVASRGQGA